MNFKFGSRLESFLEALTTKGEGNHLGGVEKP